VSAQLPSADRPLRLPQQEARWQRLRHALRDTVARSSRATLALDAVLWLTLVPAVLWMFHALFKGWTNTLIEHHAFRQTQTAYTVAFLLRGGPWLAYETPCLGYPWAIPFEFPLYQWLVALVVKATSIGIDPAGRVVSTAALLGAAVALWRLLEHLRFRRTERLPVLLLFVLSPTDLFWARTFMIETTALCAALWFLERAAQFLREQPRVVPGTLIGWAFAGGAAALVKATTFIAFAFAVASALAVSVIASWRRGDRASAKRVAFWGAVVLGSSFVLMESWTLYSNHLRTLNPLARSFLVDKALNQWVFGTWAQKTSRAVWDVWLTQRMTFYVGAPWALSAFLLIPFVIEKRLALASLASLFLYLFDFAVFTNVHVVHDYYQVANNVFLTSAIGFLIVGLMRLPALPARAAAVLVTLLIGNAMVSTYRERFMPNQIQSNLVLNDLVKIVKEHTDKDDVLFIVGADWSPGGPYYCDRRAIMDRDGRAMADPAMQEELRLLREHGYHFGALITCGGERNTPRNVERTVTLGVSVFRGHTAVGCDVYTRP
jgi:hypothetical protein